MRGDRQVERTYVVVKKTYEENVLPSAPVKAALAVKDVFYAKHPENLELFKKVRMNVEVLTLLLRNCASLGPHFLASLG